MSFLSVVQFFYQNIEPNVEPINYHGQLNVLSSFKRYPFRNIQPNVSSRAFVKRNGIICVELANLQKKCWGKTVVILPTGVQISGFPCTWKTSKTWKMKKNFQAWKVLEKREDSLKFWKNTYEIHGSQSPV